MQRIRHFIALLLLVVFVPATVMAGPLRLCLGEDGHRAVEFALKGAHHEPLIAAAGAADTHEGLVKPNVVSEASPEQHQDCTDLTLIAAAVAAVKGCSAKPQLVDAGDAPVSINNALSTLESRPPSTPAGAAGRLEMPFIGDPKLIALRTVILLI